MRRALALLAATVAALAPASPGSAVVGGVPSNPGVWPWAAAVFLVTPDGLVTEQTDGVPDELFWCTGSLIGERWILTARHCVILGGEVIGGPGVIASYLGPLSLKIVLGSTNLSDQPPDRVYRVDPAAVVALPQSGDSLIGDLALIRLDRPAPQRAIRIPGVGAQSEAEALTAPGTLATVVGWGLPFPEAPNESPNLLETQVPLLASTDCAAAWPYIDYYGITLSEFDPRTMLCGGIEGGGKGPCFGDSGGPLMSQAPSGEWLEIGVTSFGSSECAAGPEPAVWARLPGLFGFLVQALARDQVAPAGAPSLAPPAVGRVTRTSATLTVAVTPNGLATSALFEVGPNRRFTAGRAEQYAGAGSTPSSLGQTFTGLKPGKTYLVRVTATNVAGVVRSTEVSFTTRPAKAKPSKTKPPKQQRER